MKKRYIWEGYEAIVCPFCGEVYTVLNPMRTAGYMAELWSDTRCVMPMQPLIFPVQQCAGCHSFFFIRPEQHHYVDMENKIRTLDYDQLKEANVFLNGLYCLTDWQQDHLNYHLLLAYNDKFNRREGSPEPTDEDRELFFKATEYLLNKSEMRNNAIFRGELLRLRGQFKEAQKELWDYTDDVEDIWAAKAIFQHALAQDSKPFLLIESGEKLFSD